jgi:DNA/RNA endonuclease G (NUC1)
MLLLLPKPPISNPIVTNLAQLNFPSWPSNQDDVHPTMTSWKQSARVFQAATAAATSSLIWKSPVSNTEGSIRPTSEVSSFPGLSPVPPIYVFQPNPSLEIAFDARTRNPIYVMERLSPQRKNNSTSFKRPSNFFEEKSLPEEFRSRPQHYKNSGFDRGHLAAAANYMQTSQKELNGKLEICTL